MAHTNIDIVRALDRLRIDSLYVHNEELPGASFHTEKLKERKVYLVETLAVINALVDRGTMMLFGGHGGGKTTLSKYLGQIFCQLSKEQIEDCILRGHPQLTEEKILGSLDFAQMLGKKELTKGKIDVVWNEFVESKWKIIDEINRLSPYAQNILLSLLAEGSVKYHNQSMIVPPFTLYATLNPKDNANEELSLPFRDRFALALPITMPDYDSFSTIGKRDKMNQQRLEDYLRDLELTDLQEDIKQIPYTDDAEIFINYIIASYRLCERASKESNDSLSVDKGLCENCHMNVQEKVCCKIKQPLSVRVKEDLYRYGKALAWFLGYPKVTLELIVILAPYMIWHRSLLSKRYAASLIDVWKDSNKTKNADNFITNINLEGTRGIIVMIQKEFEGVKHILKKFEEVKMGKLTKEEFDSFMREVSDNRYNSLFINVEILPILKDRYLPVYDSIIDYNERIDQCDKKEDFQNLKEEIIFRYDIPNRQYLSEKIDRKIIGLNNKRRSFILEKKDVDNNPLLRRVICAVAPDYETTGLAKNKDYHLMDITRDACSLDVRFAREQFRFNYKGDEKDELFKYLESHDNHAGRY